MLRSDTRENDEFVTTDSLGVMLVACRALLVEVSPAEEEGGSLARFASELETHPILVLSLRGLPPGSSTNLARVEVGGSSRDVTNVPWREKHGTFI